MVCLEDDVPVRLMVFRLIILSSVITFVPFSLSASLSLRLASIVASMLPLSVISPRLILSYLSLLALLISEPSVLNEERVKAPLLPIIMLLLSVNRLLFVIEELSVIIKSNNIYLNVIKRGRNEI